MSEEKNFTLAELAEYSNSKVIGNGNAVVNNLASIQKSNPNSITFLTNLKYKSLLKTTKAIAIVVDEDFEIYSFHKYVNLVEKGKMLGVLTENADIYT